MDIVKKVHKYSTVVLKCGNLVSKYVLVSSDEANPSKSKISVESPLGKELLGKQEKDHISVSTPSGDRKYQILKISSNTDS